MPAGIRAEVRVDADGSCPVVQASKSADAPTYSVSRSVSPESPDRVTEEFMLEADDPEADVELTRVFDYGDKKVYRFSRALGRGCPCEAVETFDTPVVDIRTLDGMPYLLFHSAGMAYLQDVTGSLL
jgi:hypothetical protein